MYSYFFLIFCTLLLKKKLIFFLSCHLHLYVELLCYFTAINRLPFVFRHCIRVPAANLRAFVYFNFLKWKSVNIKGKKIQLSIFIIFNFFGKN